MKKVFLGIFGIMALAGSSYAAEVEATKTAPWQNITNNAYGQVDLRHYSMINMKDEQLKGINPEVQSRLMLGTTTFNKKLDSMFTFRASKSTETTIVRQRQTYFENSFSAVDEKYGSVMPYANFYLPIGGSGTIGTPGLYTDAKLPIETAIGSLKFAMSADGMGVFSSRPEKVTVEKDPSIPGEKFGLTGDKQDQMNKKDPSMQTQYGAHVTFNPSILKDLTIYGKVYYTMAYDPKYEGKVEGDDYRTEKVGYQVRNETMNRLILVYNATKELSLTSDTMQVFKDFYKERWDNTTADGQPNYNNSTATPSRVVSMLKVGYKLF